MKTPPDLKSAERKVFQTTFADGLWDIFIGCFFLEFAIAPFLSEFLGDFWSSVIFLPFWALVYLAIRSIRKKVIAPRIGSVSFGAERKNKLRKFSTLMVIANSALFLLGILVAFVFGGHGLPTRAWMIPGVLGLFLLAGFSITAHLLDFHACISMGYCSSWHRSWGNGSIKTVAQFITVIRSHSGSHPGR